MMAASEWEKERQQIADDFCGGDVEKADKMLDALPYSALPGWWDVRHVAEVFDECREQEGK